MLAALPHITTAASVPQALDLARAGGLPALLIDGEPVGPGEDARARWVAGAGRLRLARAVGLLVARALGPLAEE